MNFKNFFVGFKEGQKEFGKAIENDLSFILLTFVYFVGVGLTSLFAKIFRKHFLEAKGSSSVDSYWEDIELSNQKEGYYRQF